MKKIFKGICFILCFGFIVAFATCINSTEVKAYDLGIVEVDGIRYYVEYSDYDNSAKIISHVCHFEDDREHELKFGWSIQNYDWYSAEIEHINRGIILENCVHETGVINIPKKINGYKVTGISNYAFYNCKGATEINIPNTVKTIDSAMAFDYCTNLKKITFPDKVVFDKNTFKLEHTNLAKLTIPNSIEKCKINYCDNLKTLNLSKKCAYVYVYSANSLTQLSIPKGTQEVHLSLVPNLTKISISNTVTNFNIWQANKLKTLKLPKNVTVVSAITCDKLKKLYIYNPKATINSIKVPKVTVYAKKNSTAQKYCKENGLAFKAIK